jgi:predicted nucleotidyltransferase
MLARTTSLNEWEGGEVPDAVFIRILDEAQQAAEHSGVPYLFMGGLASAAYGRPRWTHDIDLFVRPDDVRSLLDQLGQVGFRTQETDPTWLAKGIKEGVLVDVIFRVSGDIYLDDEVLAHSTMREIKGIRLPVVSAEDLVVIKACTHKEVTPRHWYDGLAILAETEMNWDYLLARARFGARRVLSLLIYAQSNDIMVPDAVVRTLHERIYGPTLKG